MTNTTPNQQLHLQDIDDGDSINSKQHIRKRDKLRNFLGIPKSENKQFENKVLDQLLSTERTPQATDPHLVAPPASEPLIVASSDGIGKLEPKHIPTKTQEHPIIFLENLAKPATRTVLPVTLDRIEKIEQLVYCNTLLLHDEKARNTTETVVSMKTTLTEKEIEWLTEMDKNPMEKAHMRWLTARTVEEFIQDGVKDSAEISEIITLGPILDKENYRKLLSCLIAEFEDARILDTDILQGLVQLVHSAQLGYLVSDDLVKIFSVLRIRLQGTHQQSSEHSFHLTRAVSQILDIMAEHEVKDLNRVEEHEPLSGVLSGLQGSSDPYLVYQACYAFQALQYVPDDETALQAVFRHSAGVVDGMVKVSAIFKLDVAAVLKGLVNLQEALGGAINTAVSVYGGVCSMLESGQGVFESLKESLGSGQKRPWYPAIRAARAFAQLGQLKDLNHFIYEASCRGDPFFQWGICELLGEIASDSIWDTPVRQGAIDLLGELYKNDVEWGKDESVKDWMVNIIGQLGTVEDQAVNTTAHTLLRELKKDQWIVTSLPYPLRNQLPVPTSSPTLTRLQNIPYVEYDLYLHKVQRLKLNAKSVYIPPLAKPSLTAKDEDLFPLMEKVQEFIGSKRQVMLLLGDSGAGKSTFNRHLEHHLWADYKRDGPIPLFINLPAIREPEDDMITKQLRIYNFKDEQIQELKLHRQLILICDGYDESQQLVNLHKTNMLNQAGQWDTKMIISCRTQFLGPTYVDRFKPQPLDRYTSGSQDLFQEAIIAPFSKEQVKNYVEQYAQNPQAMILFNDSQSSWSAEEYMDKLEAIPNVMDLVKNPFLLTLALKALPGLVALNKDLASIRVTRARLYDIFVDQWLETNKVRLQSNTLTKEELATLNSLVEDDFIAQGIGYLLRLSAAIFKEQGGNPIVQYNNRHDKDSWKAEFFGTDLEVKLLREASPLTRTGNHYRFVHRSVLEYLFSRVIYNPIKSDEEIDPRTEIVPTASQLPDANGPLFQRNLLQEPSVISFLCDRVKLNPDFKHQLRTVIERSKTDANAAMAAANAITILVRAGVNFNGADLRGVKIPNADLSGGQFDSAQFQRADLKGVNLSKSWLRQADMSDAYMEAVQFGELPYLEMDEFVNFCAYSPDGKMLGAALDNGVIYIYDTSTWARLYRLEGHAENVRSIVFSSDSQWLVSGSSDRTIRLWDITSGEELLVMEGHSEGVSSVIISPCGNQIASASYDNTVQLWDAHTGERLFVLEGHTSSIYSVKFSPNGCQILSGSDDGTIRFRDPTMEVPVIVLSSTSGAVTSLAYSPNGRQFAAGDEGGGVQLWDAVTLESGPILRGHTRIVTGIDFSPDGQWIASSSFDETVRLWDVSTSTLVTVLTGHNILVTCVAFSPDSRQISSGGLDRRVRLWEIGVSRSSLDTQDGSLLRGLGYSRDGQSIFSSDESGFFRQWDATTGSYMSILYKLPVGNQIFSTAYTPDGSQLALGYHDGSIRLWNCDTGTAGAILNRQAGYNPIVICSPCCRWIVSRDWNDTMLLWDLHDVELQGLPVDARKNLNGVINGMIFCSRGGQLATWTYGGTICLFGTQTRECLGLLKCGLDISTLVYSPNDQQIAIVTKKCKILLWDLQTKEPSAVLEGHEVWIHCIAYSPCGQWIASGNDDCTVGIWRHQWLDGVESWSKVHSLRAFFRSVQRIAWNPVVPMELLTGGYTEGSVQLWRMSVDESGKVVFELVWGSNLGVLYTDGAIFTNAIGLSPIYQKLLIQRGG